MPPSWGGHSGTTTPSAFLPAPRALGALQGTLYAHRAGNHHPPAPIIRVTGTQGTRHQGPQAGSGHEAGRMKIRFTSPDA